MIVQVLCGGMSASADWWVVKECNDTYLVVAVVFPESRVARCLHCEKDVA